MELNKHIAAFKNNRKSYLPHVEKAINKLGKGFEKLYVNDAYTHVQADSEISTSYQTPHVTNASNNLDLTRFIFGSDWLFIRGFKEPKVHEGEFGFLHYYSVAGGPSNFILYPHLTEMEDQYAERYFSPLYGYQHETGEQNYSHPVDHFFAGLVRHGGVSKSGRVSILDTVSLSAEDIEEAMLSLGYPKLTEAILTINEDIRTERLRLSREYPQNT